MHTVALFGEILADIFPDYTVLGGAPYNVARHLQALQLHPVLVSKTGDDALKTELFTELHKLEMDTAGIQIDASYSTGQVLVHMENKQHRFEIKPNQAYDHIDARLTRKTIAIAQPNLVYFGTLAQRHTDSKQALGAFLDNSHCPRFLDLNLRAPWYNKATIESALSQADIVKINDDELQTICQLYDVPLNNNQDCAHYLIENFKLQQLFVTCGEYGAWAYVYDTQPTHVACSSLSNQLVDTVGAGDAFSAVCILGILQNWSTNCILTRANAFATDMCTVKGAVPASTDFYLPYIKDWS